MSGHRVHIGYREAWGGRESVALQREDRRQHVYIIGKTGTGKSTLLKNMILQDIAAGEGVGLIDPHGDLAIEILDHIPPGRIRDTVYFNPADQEFPIGLNLLRAVPSDRRHLVASGLVSAFKNVWRDSWGPRLEYTLYCSIAALTWVETATLLGIQRILIDERYRRWVVKQVGDPMVRSFWQDEFEGYDSRLRAEVIAPLQNKVGQLVMSPIVRNVLGQVRSRVDIRYLMDHRKVLIANLSKGHLGEDKSSLLGSLLVAACQFAAMCRSDTPMRNRRDWHLYVDEFQSFATDSFATILSEARKFRLNLTLAHQYSRQLRDSIRDAVFGNVGTLIAFRVTESDARMLAEEFGNGESANTFTDLANFETRTRVLDNGRQRRPETVNTVPCAEAQFGRSQSVIRRSRQAYGTQRGIVEDRIERWRENHRGHPRRYG